MLLLLLQHVLLLGFLVRFDTTSDILFFLLFLKFFVFISIHAISHPFHDCLNLMFPCLNLVIAFLDLSFHISFCLFNQLYGSFFVNFLLLLSLLFFHFIFWNDQPCSLSLCFLLLRKIIALYLQIFLKFFHLVRFLFLDLPVLVVFFSLSFFQHLFSLMHLCKCSLSYIFLLLFFNFQAFACDFQHFFIFLFYLLIFLFFWHLLGLDLLIQNYSHLLLLGFERILFFFLYLLVEYLPISVYLPPFIGTDVRRDILNLLFAAYNSCGVDVSERTWLNVRWSDLVVDQRLFIWLDNDWTS